MTGLFSSAHMINITLSDYKRILYWYDVCFKKKIKPTDEDIKTWTKISALAICDSEEKQREKNVLEGKPYWKED